MGLRMIFTALFILGLCFSKNVNATENAFISSILNDQLNSPALSKSQSPKLKRKSLVNTQTTHLNIKAIGYNQTSLENEI